jgi:hypothetical protein
MAVGITATVIISDAMINILITHNTTSFLIRMYPLHEGVRREGVGIFARGIEERWTMG